MLDFILYSANLVESEAENKRAEKSTRQISPRDLNLAPKKQSVSCSHTLVKKKVKFQTPRKSADNLASDSVSQDSDSSQRLVCPRIFTDP